MRNYVTDINNDIYTFKTVLLSFAKRRICKKNAFHAIQCPYLQARLVWITFVILLMAQKYDSVFKFTFGQCNSFSFNKLREKNSCVDRRLCNMACLVTKYCITCLATVIASNPVWCQQCLIYIQFERTGHPVECAIGQVKWWDKDSWINM